jgi:hypothetical protein
MQLFADIAKGQCPGLLPCRQTTRWCSQPSITKERLRHGGERVEVCSANSKQTWLNHIKTHTASNVARTCCALVDFMCTFLHVKNHSSEFAHLENG